MAGWSHEKRLRVESAFYSFLNQSYIFSKEGGRICIGHRIYDGQKRVITEIFNALEDDVHSIAILKSRQLGISTIIRLLTTFLIGLNPGMLGAIVFDIDANKNKARTELENVIGELPARLKFPKIARVNRQSLILAQKAEIIFKSAGVTKGKSSSGLGRSVGLSFLHASELCEWGDPGGLESLRNALAETNEDRLFIYESTAKGYNLWYDLWKEMRSDPVHNRAIFIGWWAHDLQQISRSDRDWPTYGAQDPTDKELEKIAQVKKLYGVDVSREQLAWVRRKYDPTARSEGDTKAEFEASSERIQEQPWTEDEAFRTSGAIFFSNEKLTDQTKKWVEHPASSYMFLAGEEFSNMRVLRAENTRSTELRLWEEPQRGAYYAVGIDPAYGENPQNDRSAIEIFRCYADGLDQVAEYAFTLVNTRQLAWVAASLLSWYGNEPGNEVRYILELNGAGIAVWNELRSLRQQIDTGYPPFDSEPGIKDTFRNVQSYLRQKEDSLGPSYNWHIKTSQQSKVGDLEMLRDFVSNGQIHIRSRELIDEMATIERDDATIKAPAGKKDDRTLAAAFAVRCWAHKIRPMMVSRKLTREVVKLNSDLSMPNRVQLFNQGQMELYHRNKQMTRIRAMSNMRPRSLWGR